MSVHKKILAGRRRRVERVRKKTRNTSKNRISVFRSAHHIYAQLIDDAQQKTVVSCSTVEMRDIKGEKKK